MNRPWHYWLLYCVCLAVVASTLSWLAWQALALDRAEAKARRQAELEDNIGRALWRMDVRMMPLIAKEAARPHFLYQPFYSPPTTSAGKSLVPPVPSPLLTQQSEFVILNFQLDPDNRFTSAQLPSPEQWQRAIECGAQESDLLRCEVRLNQLRNEVAYPDLLAKLPEESFQDILPASVQSNNESALPSRQFVANQIALPETPDGQSGVAVPVQQSAAQPAVDDNADYRLQRSQLRNNSDLVNRNVKFQTLTQQEYVEQRVEWQAEKRPGAREGISRPVWIDTRLLLARRVDMGGQSIIQGCWLDWPQIKQVLLGEITDLLPSADLVPVRDSAQADVHRMLATLPVQLVVAAPAISASSWTPMRTALVIAWISLVLVAVAAAILLRGVLSLSERRAAFVSAVTHELRTPLTTFRMYSEMLAQGMVPDANQRRRYLETLRVEADRLAHLVENVLSYARLERGRRRRHCERINVAELVSRIQPRLDDRATHAEMVFVVEADEAATKRIVETDPGAVEQILFNLVDNACKYAARAQDRQIHLRIKRENGQIQFIVADHGPGIAADAARRLFQPFSKSAEDAANSAAGVGLGLALSRRLAYDLGGRLKLDPRANDGAAFILSLPVADMNKR